AEATGDHQWIHVDVEKAAAGPFGGTIAHGYLTLSLVPWLGSQVFGLETPGAKLNYGVNKVRFPNPVRVGKRIRSHVTMGEVTEIPAGRQITLKHSIEIEGEEKPACVAETVVLLLA
ncbi:MAG TPA: MaoC family dehydratase, partial [Nocardioides sp.]|nr:MaoC family dehydratase [Nocardioides sp.]